MNCFMLALLIPPIALSALIPLDRGVRRTTRGTGKELIRRAVVLVRCPRKLRRATIEVRIGRTDRKYTAHHSSTLALPSTSNPPTRLRAHIARVQNAAAELERAPEGRTRSPLAHQRSAAHPRSSILRAITDETSISGATGALHINGEPAHRVGDHGRRATFDSTTEQQDLLPLGTRAAEVMPHPACGTKLIALSSTDTNHP